MTTPLQIVVNFKQKEFAPLGANSFYLELTPIENGANMKMEELLPSNKWMDTCIFTSFSTVVQSYQDDGRVIIKGCVQRNTVYG